MHERWMFASRTPVARLNPWCMLAAMKRAAALVLVLVAGLGLAGAALAQARTTLTIVTSFPAGFYEPVQEAFEAARPDIRLRIVNRKTTSAVTTILDRSREQADIFWASSPDAFEALARAGRLERLPEGFPRGGRIGVHPIDDPGGRYAGFAISGYGIVWHADYLSERDLPAPASIAALGDPAYRGHIVMTTPSRSGTTHLMVESVLQQAGWEKGWATWMEIGGNLATIVARSYGVGAAVAQKRVGIGLSIDFLGRTRDASVPLRFAYPEENVFLPVSVAILDGARNRAAAEAFVAFLVSAQGQRLLTSPRVGRLPSDPAAYADARPDAGNPFEIVAAGGADGAFDVALSAQRYELLNLLFDEAITFRLPALQETWAQLHAVEAAIAGAGRADAAAMAAEARRLLGAVPVTESDTRDPAFSEDLRRVPWGVAPSLRQAALVATWRAFLDDNLSRAREKLDAAQALLRQPAPGSRP